MVGAISRPLSQSRPALRRPVSSLRGVCGRPCGLSEGSSLAVLPFLSGQLCGPCLSVCGALSPLPVSLDSLCPQCREEAVFWALLCTRKLLPVRTRGPHRAQTTVPVHHPVSENCDLIHFVGVFGCLMQYSALGLC